MLATLRESQILFSPGINGYRRTRWIAAPPNTVTWAHDNRMSALRIPNGPDYAKRFEQSHARGGCESLILRSPHPVRCAEALDRKIDPGKEAVGTTSRPGVKRLHREIFPAWEDSRNSDFIARRFGKGFRRVLFVLKEMEITVFESHVTRLEHELIFEGGRSLMPCLTGAGWCPLALECQGNSWSTKQRLIPSTHLLAESPRNAHLAHHPFTRTKPLASGDQRMSRKSPYDILGVAKGADEEAIKKASAAVRRICILTATQRP